MDGLETYYGNPISEHADRNLNLTGIGKVLAISGRSNMDTLACLKFKSEFGVNNVYELKSNREKHLTDKHIVSRHVIVVMNCLEKILPMAILPNF